MGYPTLADIYASNERLTAQYMQTVAGCTAEQATFRAAPDEWTIAEIAEHIAIVNDGFGRICNRLLKQAETEPQPAPTELNLPLLLMEADGTPRGGKFPAPERVQPQGSVALAEALARNAQAIAGLAALEPRIAAVGCSKPTFPHPALGEINLYQWLALLGEHTERHRRQIERVKAAAGYPA